MKTFVALTAGALLALAFVGVGAAGHAKSAGLVGEVGPGFSIEVKKAGKDLKTIKHGTYTIKIEDKSTFHNFHLKGPGLNKLTTVAFKGDRTWTITLRTDVRFQDGMPFNAAAVVANSRRWQSSAAGRKLLPHLFAVDAPRPDEVRFLLDQPVPDLVSRLSSPRLGIVSPLALDPQSGRGARFLPDATGSGSGPFQLGPRGPGRLSLTRFAGWWGSPLGLGPSLDGVSFVLAPQPDQRLRLLKDGAVQVADPLGAVGLRAADADPLLESVGGPLTGIGLEGSVRGIDSATTIPVLSGVWLTRLTG